MDRMEIRSILNDVFREVFEDPTIEVHDKMTAADIEEWDSLHHIDLIVAIESRFKIKFSLKEVANLANVGELTDLVARKAGAAA